MITNKSNWTVGKEWSLSVSGQYVATMWWEKYL